MPGRPLLSSHSARPGTRPTEQALELADGMWHEARLLGAGIVGGDLVSAPQWVISVTALGDLDGREPVLRSGARPGDTVAVAGELGRSAAGYALWHSDVRQFDELRRRHLVPEPPYGQGRVAADAGATAMTDVSDGLLADVGHIAQASGVGIDVLIACPGGRPGRSSPALPAWWAPTRWNGCSAVAKTMRWSRRFPGSPPEGWRVIGRVLDGPPRVLVDGAEWDGDPGWQSF